MELFVKLIGFILLITIVGVPLFAYLLLPSNKKKQLSLLQTVVLASLLLIVFAWWTDKSTEILLIHYDALTFREDFGTYEVSTENVKPENLERVEILIDSYFGLGWPMKLVVSSVIYLPLLIVLHLVQYEVIRAWEKRKSSV